MRRVRVYSQLVQHGQALRGGLLPQEDPAVIKLKGHGDLRMLLQSTTSDIKYDKLT